MFCEHLRRWKCLASTNGLRSVNWFTTFTDRICSSSSVCRHRNHDRWCCSRNGIFCGKNTKDFGLWKNNTYFEIFGLRFLSTITTRSCSEFERQLHSTFCLSLGAFDRSLIIQHRTMAGHSKWQNIKHIKQSKDAEKSLLFSKLARQMKLAVQLGKSSNPRSNVNLAQVVNQAKQANMPVSKIESILKQCETSKDVLTPFTMEVKGPGGCFIIIETLTDNINRTRSNLKFQVNKIGATVVEGLKHAFNHKGVINVDPNASNLNLEAAVSVAIEVGSEDVVEANDDGADVLQFQCDPNEFYTVKNALESKGYILKTTGLHYLPVTKVTLSDDQLTLMAKFFQALEENPDVTNIFDNIA